MCGRGGREEGLFLEKLIIGENFHFKIIIMEGLTYLENTLKH